MLEGRPPKPLVYVRTADKLATVVRTLFEHKCSMAPILTADPGDAPGSPLPSVLHIATLSGVLNCLMRHFRASLASLPLLALPLSQLPIGTWAPEQQFVPGGVAGQQQQQQLGAGVNGGGSRAIVSKQQQARSSSTGDGDVGRSSTDGGGGDGSGGGGGVIVGRTVAPLHAVKLTTPLTTALGLLLEAGVSWLVGFDIGCLAGCLVVVEVFLLLGMHEAALEPYILSHLLCCAVLCLYTVLISALLQTLTHCCLLLFVLSCPALSCHTHPPIHSTSLSTHRCLRCPL